MVVAMAVVKVVVARAAAKVAEETAPERSS